MSRRPDQTSPPTQDPIKITHLCTLDKAGGAAKASFTLHTALRALGVDHRMLVCRKNSDDPTVLGQIDGRLSRFRARVAWRLDMGLIHRIFHPWECWSLGIAGNRSLRSHSWIGNADIVSLSWTSAFLGVKDIAVLLNSGKPVVWTLYDMWAFTGGCHYSGGCAKYTESCGSCPQLGQKWSRDLSSWVWQRKHKQWNLHGLTVVCPSRWLGDCAGKSSLFGDVDIRVIPTGVDTGVFHARKREKARSTFGLPHDKALLLFIAPQGVINQRKGGPLLEKALLRLAEENLSVLPDLVILGGGSVSDEIASRFRVHDVQVQSDEALAKLYSACDILVAPSMEDNLPLAVLESMACQTPCVAFRIGGMPDVIEHKVNGYLAAPFDSGNLAAGIGWLLEDEYRLGQLGAEAVKTIAGGFTAEQEAEQYLGLFREKLPGGQVPACG